eukprot:scaffold396_cov339-Prasinococcus_capsulatus_cf.AAC.5
MLLRVCVQPKSLKDEPSPPSRQTSKSGNNGAGNNTNPSTSNSNKKRARDDDDEHHFEGPKMELALPSSIKEELVRLRGPSARQRAECSGALRGRRQVLRGRD